MRINRADLSEDKHIVTLTPFTLPTYAGRTFDALRPIPGMVGSSLDAWPGRAHGRKASPRDGQPRSNISTPRSPSWNPTACPQLSPRLSIPASRGAAAAKELAQAQAAAIRLLTWDEPQYPQRLLEIYDPPPLLYVHGNIELLNRHLLSIVGSRRPTLYGNQMTDKLARDLADRGLVIVSGLARGIDSCAHKGALSSPPGATIGVLGCGIDVIYPKENKKLFAEMENRGAIISESAMGTFPGPQNFPIRNRIISGMAVGVVVVEGAQYSGSLITARLAMEFGREVYGVLRERY